MDRTTSLDATSASSDAEGTIPAALARWRVRSLRSSRTALTERPCSMRLRPTAAPIAPGLTRPTRLGAMSGVRLAGGDSGPDGRLKRGRRGLRNLGGGPLEVVDQRLVGESAQVDREGVDDPAWGSALAARLLPGGGGRPLHDDHPPALAARRDGGDLSFEWPAGRGHLPVRTAELELVLVHVLDDSPEPADKALVDRRLEQRVLVGAELGPERLGDQAIAGAEMAEHRPHAESGPGGHVLDGDRQAGLGQRRPGGLVDALSGQLALGRPELHGLGGAQLLRCGGGHLPSLAVRRRIGRLAAPGEGLPVPAALLPARLGTCACIWSTAPMSCSGTSSVPRPGGP